MIQNDEKLNRLLHDTPQELLNNTSNYSDMYDNMKNGVKAICGSLSVSSQSYVPEQTLKEIDKFLTMENKMFRILYSELSNWLMSMEDEERGSFSTNVEQLLLYTLREIKSDNVVKIIVKIYDHTQLVTYQIQKVESILSPRIAEAKIDIHTKIKAIEREYITILGIFAAIILAFVGSFTFSTSVLNNIGNVSLNVLMIITLLIGVVFFNLIEALMHFLKEINGISSKGYNWKFYAVNFLLIISIVILFLGENKIAKFLLK